jgi:hypothetical protein
VSLIESLLQLPTRIGFLTIENFGPNIQVSLFFFFLFFVFKGLGDLTTPINKPSAIVFFSWSTKELLATLPQKVKEGK